DVQASRHKLKASSSKALKLETSSLRLCGIPASVVSARGLSAQQPIKMFKLQDTSSKLQAQKP
ncbi:MAG: hypothetical protein KF797_02970, partial [Flavobacteriales bacterium]|nr:hypothetical protein [Flavobacteriales bacterium]